MADNTALPPHPAWQFWHWHIHHATARGTSISTAVVLDLVILFLLLPLHDMAPQTQQASDTFWVTFFVALTLYVVVQQWTLSKQTGTGQETEAGWDKIGAISPVVVTALCFVWWAAAVWFAGHDFQVAWRNIVVALAFSAFGVVDYFTTDITNMRLRSLQLQSRPAGT